MESREYDGGLFGMFHHYVAMRMNEFEHVLFSLRRDIVKAKLIIILPVASKLSEVNSSR